MPVSQHFFNTFSLKIQLFLSLTLFLENNSKYSLTKIFLPTLTLCLCLHIFYSKKKKLKKKVRKILKAEN